MVTLGRRLQSPMGPLHRNVFGKADHALVMCRWRWRLHPNKSHPRKDWSLLLKEETVGLATTVLTQPPEGPTASNPPPFHNHEPEKGNHCAKTLSPTPPRKKSRLNLDSSDDSGSDKDSGEDDEDNPPPLVPMRCMVCNHELCGRQVWLSPDSPVTRDIITCGSSITPTGRIYCCICGDYYRPASKSTTTSQTTAGISKLSEYAGSSTAATTTVYPQPSRGHRPVARSCRNLGSPVQPKDHASESLKRHPPRVQSLSNRSCERGCGRGGKYRHGSDQDSANLRCRV